MPKTTDLKREQIRFAVDTITKKCPVEKGEYDTPFKSQSRLYVTRRPTGALTFVSKYRYNGKRSGVTYLTLKHIDMLSEEVLTQVAEQHRVAMLILDVQKRDPKIELKKHDGKLGENTLGAVAKKWDAARERLCEKGELSKNTRSNDHYGMKDMLAHLGENTVITEIEQHEIKGMYETIMDDDDRGSMARICGKVTNMVFEYAAETLGLYGSKTNKALRPTLGLQLPKNSDERQRVLSHRELRWLFEALYRLEQEEGFNPRAIALVKLMLLTGNRRGEWQKALIKEFRKNSRIWVLPKERAKNRVEQHIPLTNMVNEVLASVPEMTNPSALRIGGFEHVMWKRRILKRMIEVACEETGVRYFDGMTLHDVDHTIDAETANWTWHDLRRTAATLWAEAGIESDVIEALLNHVAGKSKGGVAGNYNTHAYMLKKIAGLATGEQYLKALLAGNVTDEKNIVRGLLANDNTVSVADFLDANGEFAMPAKLAA